MRRIRHHLTGVARLGTYRYRLLRIVRALLIPRLAYLGPSSPSEQWFTQRPVCRLRDVAELSWQYVDQGQRRRWGRWGR